MNRVLTWALVATCALSVWALSSKPGGAAAQQDGVVIMPAARSAVTKPSAVASNSVQTGPISAWPKPDMDVATRSPFASPSPSLPKPLVEATAMLPPAPPAPPLTLNYRFWGRMSSPDKNTFMFLVKGQEGPPVAIQTGTHLDGGWSVEAISDNTVVLANAATQRRTTIFVPPADTAPR